MGECGGLGAECGEGVGKCVGGGVEKCVEVWGR